MSETLYTSIRVLAKRLGVSQNTVRRWIRYYGLPAFREPHGGNTWLCLESSLCRWLAGFERQCRK